MVVAWMIAISELNCGGGWINFCGIGTILATFPVALLADKLGFDFDYRNLVQVGLYISICALPIYLLGAGVERLYKRYARR
jgi:hypothetical protein